MNITEYLDSIKVEYKIVGDQLNLHGSPCCGNLKWNHFYMNQQSGLCDCKPCGFRGNLEQYVELQDDKNKVELSKIKFEVTKQADGADKVYNKPSENLPIRYAQKLWGLEVNSQQYLKDRGLEEKALKYFKIGADVYGQLTIPIYEKGELINIRRRKSPTDTNENMPKYYGMKGCKAGMFNDDILEKTPNELYITEGEFDAMQLWQRGIKNVISITLGAGYFPEEWVERLKGVKKIYLGFDNDDAGAEGAKKAAEKLGEDRCYRIKVPTNIGKDWSEFFLSGKTKQDFIDLVNSSQKFDVDQNVKHISEFDEELMKKLLDGDYNGISTGYSGYDSVIGGYRKGRLIVVSGVTSTGKTSFSENCTLNLVERSQPVFFISMEMPPLDLYKKFIMMKKKIKGETIDTLNKNSVELKMVSEGMQQMGKTPLYFHAGTGEIKLENIKSSIKTAKECYGAKVIFIDHLHYLVQSSGNRATETANVVRDLKNMAMSLDVCIVLLAHLNRSGRQQQKRGLYIPVLSDLKDAGAIEQDADQVIFVCRDSEAEDEGERKKTVIKVAKNRDGKVGYCNFSFELDICYFSEVVGEPSFASALTSSVDNDTIIEIDDIQL